MRKPAIPSVLSVQDRSIAAVLGPIKENIEILTGVREGLISTLVSDATTAQIISKINEIINRLNFHE
tara:strand:- start:1395 stop:1595 length:201 start_codon:yes stop_codon:yes gene_type:complete